MFHNLSAYESHLLIKELGKNFNRDDIGVIVENNCYETLALMLKSASKW